MKNTVIIEEVNGKRCIFLPDKIVRRAQLHTGDIVRIMADKQVILITSEELCTD